MARDYSKVTRLFELRRKKYGEGLSDAEQGELADLNTWAQRSYSLRDPVEAAAPEAGDASAAETAVSEQIGDGGGANEVADLEGQLAEAGEFASFSDWADKMGSLQGRSHLATLGLMNPFSVTSNLAKGIYGTIKHGKNYDPTNPAGAAFSSRTGFGFDYAPGGPVEDPTTGKEIDFSSPGSSIEGGYGGFDGGMSGAAAQGSADFGQSGMAGAELGGHEGAYGGGGGEDAGDSGGGGGLGSSEGDSSDHGGGDFGGGTADHGGGGDAGGGDGGGGEGGCFITTAVRQLNGEEDDGPTLSKLRNFRDSYMRETPARRQLVDHYYQVGPKITQAIPKDSPEWGQINDRVTEIAGMIDRGENDAAMERYSDMMEGLSSRYLRGAGNRGPRPTYEGPGNGVARSGITRNSERAAPSGIASLDTLSGMSRRPSRGLYHSRRMGRVMGGGAPSAGDAPSAEAQPPERMAEPSAPQQVRSPGNMSDAMAPKVGNGLMRRMRLGGR